MHALPARHILFVVALYLLLCGTLLTLLLHLSPLGWQGQSAASAKQSPQGMAYYSALREQHDAILSAEARLPQHPSGSLAATLLTGWRMALPPPLPSPDALVSEPLDATWAPRPRQKASSGLSNATASLPGRYPLGPSGLQLVTWGSAASFSLLENLLGSIALWEPSLRVIVYDIGFTQNQVVRLQCVENIAVRPVDFDAIQQAAAAAAAATTATVDDDAASPSTSAAAAAVLAESKALESGQHVRLLQQGAFKPLILWDALHHVSGGGILMLDPRMELRQPLRGLRALLEREGFFAVGARLPSVGAARTIGRQTMPSTFRQLGVLQLPFNEFDLCAGDVLGVVKSSPMYESLALPFARCALRKECWAPPGSSRDTHRFESSVWSVLLLKQGLSCPRKRVYRELDLARCTLRHDRFWTEERGGPVLCVRGSSRGGGGSVHRSDQIAAGPYAQELRSSGHCLRKMCAPDESTSSASSTSSSSSAATVAEFLSGLDRPWSHAEASRVLARCLQPRHVMYSVAGDGAIARGLVLRLPAANGEQMLTPVMSTDEAKADLRSCLAREDQQRHRCTREVANLHAATLAFPSLSSRISSALESLRTILLAGLRMPSAYALFALVAYALLRRMEGAAFLRNQKHPLMAAWAALWIAVFLGVMAADRDQEQEF